MTNKTSAYNISSSPLYTNNTSSSIMKTNLTINRHSTQCLCIEGVECYQGRMCEQCAYGYVRTGIKECRFCDVYPIPPIQLCCFVVVLLVILTVFIKFTVQSAGSSSPAGSMKKIVINNLKNNLII